MRSGWLVWIFVPLFASPVPAQFEPPAESLFITASSATTWVEEQTTVALLEGPVVIELGRNRLSARQAVVWILPVPRAIADEKRVEIALLGDARLVQPNQIERTGNELFVDAQVRGPIRLTAGQRTSGSAADTELYQRADAMRRAVLAGGRPGPRIGFPETQPGTQPSTQPGAQFRPLQPVTISADQFRTTLTPEGKVAAVLSGNVTLLQRTAAGAFLELQADHVVVLTPLASLADAPGAEQLQAIEQAVVGAYLEGDVRINVTPAAAAEPDQRLTGERAYYDFTTDRAVLTDVVLHTRDPKTKIPIIVRAEMVRQLSKGEFTAEDARISTSAFHTPSYSIGASSAYIRQEETGTELGRKTTFVARHVTFDVGPVPVFYLPIIGGSVAERNALRELETSSSSGFGLGVSTEWGLFETFGRAPPPGLDMSYRLDYFADRGPAAGFDAQYTGGFIDETTLQPWSFSGDFTSYIVDDHGRDRLGRRRARVEPEDETRGRFYWEHQHFFPNDWQVQVTGGYISDPTFMEEWFQDEFRNSRPLDTSLYAKRQRDSEAFTFLTSIQPNDFVTVSNLYQEQAEIERFPEIGYWRIGDGVFDDRATFFSANVISRLEFEPSDASLRDLGFRRIRGPLPGRHSPGIPSFGDTGTPEDETFRGDFRQELNWPFTAGQFRVVPYVVGRYTGYSDAVDGSSEQRVYAGAGARITTAFWKVDDTVESTLFDLHRLRHVIEPELDIYAAGQNVERSDLLIYDEEIDGITDISAVHYTIRQRWQTKRGGPGRWRSVDFFTLNVGIDYFFNQPPDAELTPIAFRGLYFVSRPETSLPRRSVNSDATWTVSDSVRIFGDAQFNLEENEMATAAIGISVRQDPRVSYHFSLRHIELELEQVIGENTFIFESQDLFIAGVDYELTSKYRVTLAHSYDFAQNRHVRTALSLIRQFDRFFASVTLRADRIEDDNAIFFNVWPEGLQPGRGTQGLGGTFLDSGRR